ncbi:MAG: ferritin-like domain-containing protein [Pseudomonadota bacterium]|nr:ferritin-like domain-containing protein [Pseudomonadota bacterium]
MNSHWRAAAFATLTETDPQRKCAGIAALRVGEPASAPSDFDWSRVPGRPQRPELIHPRDVPRRSLGSVAGRCALIHAVAHIEFNAMNLALDAVCRFDGLPIEFYADWISVAQDEARHFAMLRTRLLALGSDYGEFTAHNGLWEAAEKTASDPLVRMALVPRVLEARGLDVSPGIIERLRSIGDSETQEILEVILAEEVRHVALGTQWYHRFCAERGIEPAETFRALLRDHNMRLSPPFNREARLAAGFELAEFQS